MAITASDIQNAIDNLGRIDLDPGSNPIYEQIILEGKSKFLLNGHQKGYLEWMGDTSTPMFKVLYDTGASTYTFEKFEFRDVEAVSEVDRSGIIYAGALQRPNYGTFDNCAFTTTGAYAIEFIENDYTVSPRFKNMRTFGSGALRGMGTDNTGAEPYWWTSLCMIDGWVHDGSERLGPAFDLSGAHGLTMRNIIDKGSPALYAALDGLYEGPVSLKMNAAGFPCQVTNYKVKYDTDFTDAPGCWLHEFREDNNSAIGVQSHVTLTACDLHDYNIDDGVPHTRFFGGHTAVTGHGQVIDLEKCLDLDGDKLYAGGRVWVRANNTWYTPSASGKLTAMNTWTDSMVSGFHTNVIQTATDRPPRETITTPLYESGEDLYDNFLSAPDDFRTILEGL